MKKYMVVCLVDGETSTAFFDGIMEADNYRMDVECGLGGYAEVYERTDIGDGIMAYQPLYS